MEQKLIFRWLYPALLLVLPFIFFSRGTGMDIMLGDGDAFVQFLPFWQHAAKQWRNWTPPFWTPDIFGGFPLLAEPQASIFHPLKVLFFFLSPLAAFNMIVLIHYGLAGLFTYLLAREERLSEEASFLAGLAYAFCGFVIGHQGITTLFSTTAVAPAFFYALRRSLRRPDSGSVFMGALVVLLLVLSGHPQMFFYALFFSLFYGIYLAIFEAVPEIRRRFLKCLAGIYILGAAISAFQLLPTYELARRSLRTELTYQVFVDKSMNVGAALLSLLSTRVYALFPNDGSEDKFHVGLLVLILALVGSFRAFPRSRFWAGLAVFALLLVVGNHTKLYRLMYWVPGYNLFRLSSRNGVVLDLAVALLAGFGLHRIQMGSDPVSTRKKWVTLLLLPPLYWFCFHWTEERIFRALQKVWNLSGPLPFTRETVRLHIAPLLPEIAIMLLGGILITCLLLYFGRGRGVALVCSVLAFTYLWQYRNWIFVASASEVNASLNQRSILLEDPSIRRDLESRQFRYGWGGPSNWINFLLKDRSTWRYRYVRAAGVDFNMLQNLPSASGYSPLIPSFHSRLAGNMQMSGYSDQPDFFSSPALTLLNVKYLIVPPEELGFRAEVFSLLERLAEVEGFSIYKNNRAPGMFWGVEFAVGATEAEFWKALEQPGTDFLRSAFLMEPAPPGLTSRTFVVPEQIEFRQLDGNTMEVGVKTGGESLLVSSHPYYPGWFAWMDGNRIEILKVNGSFSGILVPPGSHRIVFRFIPVSFWIGLISGIVILALFWVASRKDLLGLVSKPT